jgi:hypothetical protein
LSSDAVESGCRAIEPRAFQFEMQDFVVTRRRGCVGRKRCVPRPWTLAYLVQLAEVDVFHSYVLSDNTN